MSPTTKLRFVIRYEPTPIRILQQWWQTNNTVNLGFGGEVPIGETKGEWRDVPLEEQA